MWWLEAWDGAIVEVGVVVGGLGWSNCRVADIYSKF